MVVNYIFVVKGFQMLILMTRSFDEVRLGTPSFGVTV